MSVSFFPEKYNGNPRVYAYSDSHEQYSGLLKIGYTTQAVSERVKQQYPTLTPGKPTYNIHLDESAVKSDGTTFTDKDVHRYLKKKGFLNPDGEWFKCNVKDVLNALLAIKNGDTRISAHHNNFSMRPEQIAAVEKTAKFFNSHHVGGEDTIPHFLWNAKMRFGKTFTAYQLALKMGWQRILVLTFKPAVQSAWEEDLLSHTDFVDWQFIQKDGLQYSDIDNARPFVCFGSFQDFLGKNSVGGIKLKNEWVHAIHWDCIIFDEYHYGAWRENA